MTFQLLRMAEILKGKLVENGTLTTPLRNHVKKVCTVGFIIDRKDSLPPPPSFTFLTLQDGSLNKGESIQVRAFGTKKREMVKKTDLSDFILVRGEVDKFKETFYIRPSYVKVLTFKQELYHRARIALSYYLRYSEKLG